MPTIEDIEELGVKIESNYFNMPKLISNRLKPLKERMVKVDINNNWEKLVEEGYTVFSSFPI
jgi:archaeosine-15-forming tRNA-guanine transglycosylase